MDEIIFVDKPAGITSFGAVARVRRVLSAREGHKVKVGRYTRSVRDWSAYSDGGEGNKKMSRIYETG